MPETREQMEARHAREWAEFEAREREPDWEPAAAVCNPLRRGDDT